MSALKLHAVPGRGRVGCKGPLAEQWLMEQGIRAPRGANRHEVDRSGLLCARLATAEFLLESTSGGSEEQLAPLRQMLERSAYPRGVYPVLRQDFVLELSGPAVHELFLQTCAVDIVPVARESTATAGPIVMTSMIGVSVVLACRRLPAGPCFTLWSDLSYSAYFHSQLHAIAADIRGAARGDHP